MPADRDAKAAHPTSAEAKEALLDAIENYHICGPIPVEKTRRYQMEVWAAIDVYQGACYRDLDDGHGLGKAGLDAARDLIEDAVWFPLETQEHEAWLVDDDKLRALAKAIGVDAP